MKKPSFITLLLFLSSILFIIILISAAVLGFWMAKWLPTPGESTYKTMQQSLVSSQINSKSTKQRTLPLFFLINGGPETELEAITREAQLAVSHGIHRCIIRIPLPWTDTASNTDESIKILETIYKKNPSLQFTLCVSLNPPDFWLQEHSGAVLVTPDRQYPMPTPASKEWKDAADTALKRLSTMIHNKKIPIEGYMLTALAEGNWRLPAEPDISISNMVAFSTWLSGNTPSHDDIRKIKEQLLQELPSTRDRTSVLFDIKKEETLVAFLHYTSSSIASIITHFSTYIKQLEGNDIHVIVPYGSSFEYCYPGFGQCALEKVLQSPVDMIINSVPTSNRGLGADGGFAGPVDSAICHHKQWLLLENTRSGLTYDSAKGQVVRQAGIEINNVLQVQKRNFGIAFSHKMGIVWSDTLGKGNLLDNTIWDMIGNIRKIYEERFPEQKDKNHNYSESFFPAELTVVFDENSACYQHHNKLFSQRLIQKSINSVYQSGIPCQFCLLEDILQKRIHPTPLYLFLNLFYLSQEKEKKLRELFQEEKASVIWLYAPGYYYDNDNRGGASSISSLTGFQVKAFTKPAAAGSLFDIDSCRYIKKGDILGKSFEWHPMFYINMPLQAQQEASLHILARYRESEKPSMGITQIDNTWDSILLADPALTPQLLRQLISIMGYHLYIQGEDNTPFPASFIGNNIVCLHGTNDHPQKYEIDLDDFFNINDLLDTRIGWLDRAQFSLPLRFGESYIFGFTPSESRQPKGKKNNYPQITEGRS